MSKEHLVPLFLKNNAYFPFKKGIFSNICLSIREAILSFTASSSVFTLTVKEAQYKALLMCSCSTSMKSAHFVLSKEKISKASPFKSSFVALISKSILFFSPFLFSVFAKAALSLSINLGNSSFGIILK